MHVDLSHAHADAASLSSVPLDRGAWHMTTEGQPQHQVIEEQNKSLTDQEKCPFLGTPFKDCFVVNMNSQNIEQAMYYCGGNFAECERFRKEKLK